MLNYFWDTLTIYSTSRQVRIKSTFLAGTNLIFVIMIWCAYILSLELDLRKVYQKSCPVHGALVSKVKGVLSTVDLDDSLFQVKDPQNYRRIWDTSDLIFPPHGGDGEDAGFVAITNLMITANQTRGRCTELNKSIATNCRNDKDCKRGLTTSSNSGTLTGSCWNATKTCEVFSWCPLEENILPLKRRVALLEGVKNFTVMLKNSVEFPNCGNNHHRRNILQNATTDYLSNCIYDIHNDTTCPKFRLGDVVKWSGHNFSEVAFTGGVFRIEARWSCDFDWGSTVNDCFPKYYFNRIDDSKAKITPGWNFRSASYHEENKRTLRKMYGLKILIEVTGEGKQFDFLQLILTLGATIGLFSVAPLVCDFLFEVLCVLKRIKPFSKAFSNFSIKSRFQDSDDCLSKNEAGNFELSLGKKTIEVFEEGTPGSFKPYS